MPTEEQIEAGCKAFVDHLNEQGGDNAVWPHDFFESDQAVFRSMVSGIISAAYANDEAEQADEEDNFDVLGQMFEAMFVDKWDGTQAPMIGAAYDIAKAHIARRGAWQAVPDGWVLVPKQVTDEMVLGAATVMDAYDLTDWHEKLECIGDVYRTMLAATDKPGCKT